MTSYLSS